MEALDFTSNEISSHIGQYNWMIKVLIVVFLTVVASMLVAMLLNRLSRLVGYSKTVWDDIFIHSVRVPVQCAIWLVGLSWAASITQDSEQLVFLKIASLIRSVGIIVLITWFLVRFVRQSEKMLQEPEKFTNPLDQTTASALSKLLRLTIIITASLIILQTLGYSISGVLAFGGIGGIAVGFAAKDLLSNFFGGLMIYLDRPFTVGDWIRSPDKNIEGTVEHVGWRLTRIRTFSKRPLYVPNATFTNIAVENPSRMSNRRIYETIGVRYDDITKVKAIVEQVKALLKNNPHIDSSQTLIVNLNEYSPSSVDFFIYCFTHTTDWIKFHEIKEDVLLDIADIITQLGAETAYPTQTIHIPEAAVNLKELE